MNVINLIGRLTDDATIREYGKGKDKGLTANFSVAVQRNKDEADFIKCVAFGKIAEIIEEYTHKGTMVGITGALQNNNYETKDGQKRYDYQVLVSNLNILTWDEEEDKEEDEEEEKPRRHKRHR